MKIFQIIKTLCRLAIRARFLIAIRYIFWLLGLQEILPAEIIKSKELLESGEDFVELKSTNKLLLDADIPKLRKTVADMLYRAAKSLPDGFHLKLVFAYRTKQMQQKLWDAEVVRQKRLRPNFSYEQIKLEVRKFIAEPTGEGPHQTGGALDVVLLKNGLEVDMGTDYIENNNKTPMFSRYITLEQRKNREVLRNVMKKVGFTYYPGEWWHYCYGDRMWAVYTLAPHAFYGAVLL